ncbi:MAG: non-homologous end-joining DNA ligase, partial [Planctomycetota bacterium]
MEIPRDGKEEVLEVEGRSVKVTNLSKPFWPELGLTKADLLQFYVDMAPYLLPHIADRAMVMRRYPDGALGKSFFMKRAPKGHPDWVKKIEIEHDAGNVIDFPVISDLASLIWVVNLGCIDLNPWYSRTDDIDRPDYLHFDLDPGEASFAKVRETALAVHEALDAVGMPNYVKTSGSKGAHVYVPLVRGPLQKDVWTFSKKLAWSLAAKRPDLATAEYVKAKRPKGRVLLDYNQNRWGSTLASVYSVRPTKNATASAPVTWDE